MSHRIVEPRPALVARADLPLCDGDIGSSTARKPSQLPAVLLLARLQLGDILRDLVGSFDLAGLLFRASLLPSEHGGVERLQGFSLVVPLLLLRHDH